MIKANLEKERHTVPRWNSIYMAEKLGEFSSNTIKQKTFSPVSNEYLEVLLNDWKKEKNLTLAIEIISTVRLTNNDKNIDDIIEYAKNKISSIEHPPKLLIDFFNYDNQKERYPVEKHNYCIKKFKKSLINYPNNPLLWCELAREYTICGNNKKALKCINIAYNIAPNSRTILRSISRFYMHIGDLEKAHSILRESPLTKFDPWVLSAEISISNLMGRTSKNIKLARTMIDSKNYSPISISELASEIGTMELYNGKTRIGKNRIKQAAIQPFENAVAQMAWINKNVCGINSIISKIPTSIECNYEAQTRLKMQSHDWEEAQFFSGLWQEYQPFSHDPAMISSFISSEYLMDFEKAKKSLVCGLQSNPNNVDLLNNYIYALIQNNELDVARIYYNQAIRIDTKKESDSLIATGGMLNYRSGNIELGQKMYLEAIDRLKNSISKDDEMAFRALLCYAREEKRIGHDISSILKEIDSSKNSKLKEEYKLIIKNYSLYN